MEALGLDLGLFLSQIVNFGLLLALLSMLLFKPVMAKLEERAKKIEKGLADAEHAKTLRAEAEARREEALVQARHEAREIIERATRAAEQQRQEILAKARQEAHELILRAQQQVEHELEEGRTQLVEEVIDLSLAAASRLIQKELDEKRHHALIEQFLHEARDIE